jgi:PIN domain nuclease of toxin-antitoxin system
MSEIIVLDTHIWIWLINSNLDQFPSSWLERFEIADRLAVSPLSCYEIALAQSRGRLELTCSPKDWFNRALAPAKIELLPLTPEITIRAVNLSPIHKDPFDRLIIATTIEYRAKLASIDSVFSKYPELEDYLM